MIKQLAVWGLFGASFYLLEEVIEQGQFKLLDLIMISLFVVTGPLIAIPFIGPALIKVIVKIENWLEKYTILAKPVKVPLKKIKN